MLRDIDYAAKSVKTALLEKFGKQNDLQDLNVTANDRTITVEHHGRTLEGTRDDLQAAVRRAGTYAAFWEAAAKGSPTN